MTVFSHNMYICDKFFIIFVTLFTCIISMTAIKAKAKPQFIIIIDILHKYFS